MDKKIRKDWSKVKDKDDDARFAHKWIKNLDHRVDKLEECAKKMKKRMKA